MQSNQCAHIQGHLHTRYTLALILDYLILCWEIFPGVLDLIQPLTTWIFYPHLSL
jgi:hypothetical protein